MSAKALSICPMIIIHRLELTSPQQFGEFEALVSAVRTMLGLSAELPAVCTKLLPHGQRPAVRSLLTPTR